MEFSKRKINLDINTSVLKRYDSLQSELIKKVSSEINNKVDSVITEGLKRKGYSFDSENELLNFIKTNCSCIENRDVKQRLYIVDNNAFLLWNYDQEIDVKKHFNPEMILSMSMSVGSFEFL